ncbi:MAG: toxin-antitoxin system HicB family antitoxin [Nitrosotalea sp.]
MVSETNHNGQKKENFTLRINAELMKEIKEKSSEENVSVNHFISKLLETATYWNIHAPSAGWTPMPRQILLELIDRYSYDEIEALAHKLGKQIARDMLLFTGGKYDVDAWLDFLRIRSDISGFQFSEYRDGNTIKCVLHHAMGKKWAVWFKSFYEIVLNRYEGKCSI